MTPREHSEARLQPKANARGELVRTTPASRRRRSAQEGFTLIELTVALLAGLIVAMGIVGLSREATNTFHEEARSSAAEASLRTAVDRLRADLERAGFMSAGNVQEIGYAGVPRIAHPLGAPNVPTAGTPAGLVALTSLALTPGGSVANGLALSAQQPTPLTPDILQITGNMTSADQYDVASYDKTVQPGCTRLYLVPNSPALFRVIGQGPSWPVGGDADTALHNIFFPSSAAPASTQFLLRVVDANQCAQYLVTCPTSRVAGIDSNLPFVDVAAATPLVTASATGGTCGLSGYGEGSTVNPIQTVQWEITSQTATTAAEPAAYLNLGGAAAAADKYDLMRSFVSAGGVSLPDTREIVAEYAVDLSFAFSVETGTALAPLIVTLPFDDPDNNQWAIPPYNRPNIGPQRIRSVRARIVTRSAQPDRTVNIFLPTGNHGTEKFAYRYCVAPDGCATNPGNALVWARARTITTEVALPNQAGNFY
jgi:hypothetical protein